MYIYYNPNPRGKRIAGDCVIRALCKAFEAPWQDIYAALSVQGYMMGDLGNSDPVWGSYLRSKGFIRYTLPNSCPDCYTIQDFARDHAKGTYILGTGKHAVCIVDGVIYDTWDSGTDFARAINGRKAAKVWRAIDNLMGVILAINPKLYDATIEDIEKQ